MSWNVSIQAASVARSGSVCPARLVPVVMAIPVRPPRASAAWSTIRRAAASSVTSPVMAVTAGPRLAAAFAARTGSRPAMATLAAFGAYLRDDGHWGMPELTVELASPDAALHIGPQHVLLETAATSYAANLAGTGRLQMRTWHVMFLSRAKTGPFRVDGEAIRGAGATVAARVTLHDEGNDDRMVTSASAVFEIS
jgi:hypothetical protein